ncbi:Peroxidase 7 [Bienertia sinuspersici]
MHTQKSPGLAIFVIIAIGLMSSVCCQDLSYNYYDNECDGFEEIVARKVRQWFFKDNTIAASLIRLHFHDCAVRGCDASILLDHEGSEKNAHGSKTLRGYEVIDDIKIAVERKCPKTVSCADLLTAAARDATLLVKGPFWANKYGRLDGKDSYAQEADQLPSGREDVTSQLEFYQSIGMNMLDLVVLSGAHTIGRSSCGAIMDRLHNYHGSGEPDSSIDLSYLSFLRRKCKNETQYVDLDPTTPFTFDNNYYVNLEKNMGLLYSDQVLTRDHRTAQYVDMFANGGADFNNLFSSSMVKLGNVLGDSQDDGEVRLLCSRTNSG